MVTFARYFRPIEVLHYFPDQFRVFRSGTFAGPPAGPLLHSAMFQAETGRENSGRKSIKEAGNYKDKIFQ